LKKEKVMYSFLGRIKGNHLVIQDEKKTVVTLDVNELREAWRKPIWNFMG
jgi:hypothetical protein